MPRINRAIELLEQGQPIFYGGGFPLTNEGGREAVGAFLAAGDEELFREFNEIAGALDPLAQNFEPYPDAAPALEAVR